MLDQRLSPAAPDLSAPDRSTPELSAPDAAAPDRPDLGLAAPPAPQDRRRLVAALRARLAARPDLLPAHEHARRVVRAFRLPAFYEMETRCNLSCEGCYYFDGGETAASRPEPDLRRWEALFAAEAVRGVSMAYFVGAEPSLSPARLAAAAKSLPRGNIGTNGIAPIPREIPYRIGVSIWSVDPEEDRTLRGAGAFAKALRNYAGDPRAIMLFTVSARTIGEIDRAARLCADHGVELTFNLYSPTRAMRDRLTRRDPGGGGRFDRAIAPVLDAEALARARDAMDAALADHPATVVSSHAYHALMCAPGPRYPLDPVTGEALRCGSRMGEGMRYHLADLSRGHVKCGTPSVDCAQCRMYSGGWSSRFHPRLEDLASDAAFARWLEMVAVAGRIFLLRGDAGG